MIYIVGICISFFLVFLLISKKNKSLSDSILMIWLIVMGIHIGLYYLHSTALDRVYPQLLGVAIPFPILHGPFLFLYTMALTHPAYFHTKRWILHFIPAILLYLYIIPFLSLPGNEKIVVYENEGKGYENVTLVTTILVLVSGFSYVIWTSILLRKHKRRITQEFSYIEHINLRWLKYLTYLLGLTWILVTIGYDDWIFGAASLFVLFVGYYGIKQVGIFTNMDRFIDNKYPLEGNGKNEIVTINEDIKTNETEEVIKKKYLKSGLTDEQSDKLQQDLAKLMASEKLFKNGELTLSDLAEKLSIHPNYLSQVINEKEGVSFYDYINSLRIEEFKKLAKLPENKQYTLLSLAFDCGFNSKSSFNRYFKKITDLSPTEYINNLS